MGMAERLFPRNMAVDQPEVARMPSEIFPVEFRVIDGNIFHFPESVLGSDSGIVYLCVLHVLEDIFTVAFKPVDINIPAEHERICAAMEFQPSGIDAGTSPEESASFIVTFSMSIAFISLNIFGASMTVSFILRWSEYHRAERPPVAK